MLLHVLDISGGEADGVIKDFEIVRNEMESYDPDLKTRPCLVACNKTDLRPDFQNLTPRLAEYFSRLGMDFLAVSALTGDNVAPLMKRVVDFSREHPRPKGSARLFANMPTIEIKDIPARRRADKIQIVPSPDGSFRVLSPRLEKAAERYDLSQDENVARFTRLLRRHRVEELLAAAGASPGATVAIGRTEFDFYPDDDGEL
jgi:GTP-binding protein